MFGSGANVGAPAIAPVVRLAVHSRISLMRPEALTAALIGAYTSKSKASSRVDCVAAAAVSAATLSGRRSQLVPGLDSPMSRGSI